MSIDNLKEVLSKQQEMEPSNLVEREDILQVIGFIVGNEEFAVPILNIREIVKPIEFTRVPSVPSFVRGVFNLRGNVFPLISLRQKFGLKDIRQDQDTRYLVVNNNEEIAGFIIDKLTEAIRLNINDIEPIPEGMNEESNLMYGIGKQGDRLITILKVESLLKREF